METFVAETRIAKTTSPEFSWLCPVQSSLSIIMNDFGPKTLNWIPKLAMFQRKHLFQTLIADIVSMSIAAGS